MSVGRRLTVNGTVCEDPIRPGTSLLSALRRLGWWSVRRACETGDCGACTVLLDGKPIHSCIHPAWTCGESKITTLESLATGEDDLTQVQQAFLKGQGFQCGFCTSGMVMSHRDHLGQSHEELVKLLSGNFCRCTGYGAIIDSLAGRSRCHEETDRSFGRSVANMHGSALVRGKARFTGDNEYGEVLHLKVVRSPHAHARIIEINAERALRLNGVVAVYTWTDVPRIPYTTALRAASAPDCLDHFLLDNKVRFVGDRVAAVVAESVEIAEAGCELIEVDYEVLSHVIEADEAIGAGAPIIHDEPEVRKVADPLRNLAADILLEEGSVEIGFRDADHVFEETFILPRVQHAHLEPHTTKSWIGENGELVLRTSTQVPFHCRRWLAVILGLPEDKVRVFKAMVGGGFGNKQELVTEDLCAFATLKLEKPVRWELTREEEFTATNCRHPMRISIKGGVRNDGTLTALEMTSLVNTGAYANHGYTVTFMSGFVALGMYQCPHKRFQARVAYTNTMPSGAFRGYGATQGTFAVDCFLDETARRLGLDPLELKLRNIIKTGGPPRFCELPEAGDARGSYGLDECVDRVKNTLGSPLERDLLHDTGKRIGRGFGITMMGGGPNEEQKPPPAVTMSRERNGGFTIRTGGGRCWNRFLYYAPTDRS